MQRAEELYRDGKPLHVVSPSESVIKYCSWKTWKNLQDHDVQASIQNKNVIVSGSPTEDIKFSKRGISQIGGMLSRQISINGAYYLRVLHPSVELTLLF